MDREQELKEVIADKQKQIKLLCDEWADTDTYINKICIDLGIEEDKINGDSYGVPTIEDKVDLIVEKLKNE